MDCPVMAYAFGVFAIPKAEVEPQLYQVRNIPGFGVRGGGCRVHDEVYNAQGGGLFPLDWGILDPVIFEFSGEVLVQAGVSLGVGGGMELDRPSRRWVAAIAPDA